MTDSTAPKQLVGLIQGSPALHRILGDQGKNAKRERAEEGRPGFSADGHCLARFGQRLRPLAGTAVDFTAQRQPLGLEAPRS